MPTRLLPASFAGHRVLVVGEAILDRYQLGKAERISREAPIPVVTCGSSFARCGGSANTAANISSLGSEATLVAAAGKDEGAQELSELCRRAEVKAVFVEDAALDTAVKTRILASNQQLLRIDECPDQSSLSSEVAKLAMAQLEGHDVLVLSDYGLGALNDSRGLIEAARTAKIPVVVDPRGRDWSKYGEASVVTPNIEEFQSASSGFEGDDEAKAAQLLKTYGINAIVQTAGSEGMVIHEQGRPPVFLSTHNLDVHDVTGAGDTVAATLALGLAAGAGLEEAARWANLAAGIVVGKLGAATVSPQELNVAPAGHGGRFIEQQELANELELLRSAGKRIVMTNGCFDIFHAGHLNSLASAARLGDVMVVGVNDDESVRRLKGPARPVITLRERAMVLTGLGCVDFVTSFSKTSATELVRLVRPDVYVKGDDWENRQPPEAAAVAEYGGQVVYQASSVHVSTTKIIESIIENSEKRPG